MIKLGTVIRFRPQAFTHYEQESMAALGAVDIVEARIEYINREHRYFRAAYTINGKKFYECFKF